jgi:hypothetical protein
MYFLRRKPFGILKIAKLEKNVWLRNKLQVSQHILPYISQVHFDFDATIAVGNELYLLILRMILADF